MQTKSFFLTIALLAASMGGYAQKPTYKKVYLQPDERGWHVVKEKKKYGIIDDKGNIVVPIVYEMAYPYSGNFACIQNDQKWGYVNRQGEEVIPPTYDISKSFSEDLASVKSGGKWGVIDTTGKVICPFVYDDIKAFSLGFAPVKRDGKWGCIDANGKEICPPVYDEIKEFSLGFAHVKRDGKWGIIDTEGKEAVPTQYKAIIFDEGLAPLKGNGKIGFIDEECKMVIPAEYDDCAYFSHGSVAVKQNGNWGYVDREGKTLIPFKLNYEQCGIFSDGLISVRQNKKWGYVDASDQVIIPIKLDYDEAFGFSDGMARVRKKDKYGFIDRTGKEVIKPQYIAAGDFENGIATVSKVYVNLDVIAEMQAAAAALQAMSNQLLAASSAMMSTLAVQQLKMEQMAVAPGIVGPTGGNLEAEQRKQRWEQQWQQKFVEIQKKYVSDMQRAAMTGAGSGNVGNMTTSSVVPEQILLNKSGKELIPSKKRYVSAVKMDLFAGNCYLLAKSVSVDWGGAPLFFFGIYDVDKQQEVIPVKYTRFDMDTFGEKEWIVAATLLPSLKGFKHRYGIIDYSGEAIIPTVHDIFDVSVFAPHERILAGDILKRYWNFFTGIYTGYTITEASYGVIDYSGKVIIPKTIAEGIEFIDNTFVMTFKDGAKRYFDLDGQEIRK